MFRRIFYLGLLLGGCGSVPSESDHSFSTSQFTIAFGSCNKQNEKNLLWDDVLNESPDVWIWGGDNIYSDTHDMRKMRRDYEEQHYQEGYSEVTASMDILGVWDDHDYGINDGGAEYEMKEASQQLFLDFLQVPKEDPRRKREGTFHSVTYHSKAGSVKILLLDTRYFRSPLTKNLGSDGKRYMPTANKETTLLGKDQWIWLEQELANSKSDFNIIVSSIQILSDKHGFETWGNFPHEEKRLLDLLKSSKAKGVILLSGDRHISEFSQLNTEDLLYPLIDFTSSGLTHTYESYKGEENPYRVGRVVTARSFGLLELDVKRKSAVMKMIGDGGTVLQELKQAY